jgi:hypothetical protein
LIALNEASHHGQELGGGLEIVTGIAACIQKGHQAVPPLLQDLFRPVKVPAGKDPVGPGRKLPGDPGPVKDGGQKPLLPVLGAGFDVEAQFRGKAARKTLRTREICSMGIFLQEKFGIMLL